METDGVKLRVTRAAGRITLARPEALNALTQPVCEAISSALDQWQRDDAVALVVVDAEGDRAFCAGGDILAVHEAAAAGDLDRGRAFWRAEHAMNRRFADFPKPVVSLCHGLLLGGGVGLGCHASHRVVCDSTQFALPGVSLGLVADAGATALLAAAPGGLGAWFGITGTRIGPGDAIRLGFADTYVPQDRWGDLIKRLEGGTVSAVADLAGPLPDSGLEDARDWIDACFLRPAAEIPAALAEAGPAAAEAAGRVARNAPLAMAATLEIIARLRAAGLDSDVGAALDLEYRYGWRALAQGDLIEGIRAALIDRDRTPVWSHESLSDTSRDEVAAMLAPLDAAS